MGFTRRQWGGAAAVAVLVWLAAMALGVARRENACPRCWSDEHVVFVFADNAVKPPPGRSVPDPPRHLPERYCYRCQRAWGGGPAGGWRERWWP